MIKRITNICRQERREGKQQSRLWPQPKSSQLRRSLVVATKKKNRGGPQRPRSWPWLRISPTVATKKEKKEDDDQDCDHNQKYHNKKDH